MKTLKSTTFKTPPLQSEGCNWINWNKPCERSTEKGKINRKTHAVSTTGGVGDVGEGLGKVGGVGGGGGGGKMKIQREHSRGTCELATVPRFQLKAF